MIYLKLYESFDDEVKLEIEKALNNNLISDVKDMSLEYLDYGMTLTIYVYGIAHGMISPTHVRKFLSLEYKYNHNNDDHKWYLNNSTLPINDIAYEFMFERIIPSLNLIITSKDYNNICKNACDELYDRVKIAYPNETLIKNNVIIQKSERFIYNI